MKRVLYHCDNLLTYEPGQLVTQPILKRVEEHEDYNLVSSKLADWHERYHAPVLDIDIPCRYVKSSTEGHGHLYFDSLRLTWAQYVALLAALTQAGIIEPNYFDHCIAAGMSTVRPPHVRKRNTDRPAKKKKLQHPPPRKLTMADFSDEPF